MIDRPEHPRAAPRACRPGPGAPGRCLQALLAAGCACLSLAAAPAAVAQPEAASDASRQEGVFEEIDVRITETEFRVLDRRGRAVPDLEVDDFRLKVNGRETPIKTFRPPGASEDAALSGLPGVETEPLFLVVFVDTRFLEPDGLDGVREALGDFMGQAPPGARWMLTVAGEDYRVLEPFTADPSRLSRHLADLRGRPGGGRLPDQYSRLLRQMQRQRTLGGLRQTDLIGPADSPIRRGEPRGLLAEIEAFDEAHQRALVASGRDLDRLLTALSGLPGKRHLIYLGDRLPTGAAGLLVATWQATFQQRPADRGAGNVAGRLDDGSMDAMAVGQRGDSSLVLFRELGLRAAASGVVFHAVTTRGPRRRAPRLGSSTDASLGPSSARNPSRSDLVSGEAAAATALGDADGLRILAESTGGGYHGRGRNFGDFFSGLRRDLESGYRIGWSAPPGDWPVAIELRRRLRGAKIHHPSLARVRTRDQIDADRPVAALSVGEGLENPLGVEVEIGTPAQREGGAWWVPVAVRVPLGELALLPERGSHAGRLSIFVTAGGFDSGVSPVSKAIVPVRVRNQDLLTALGRQVDYRGEVPLPAPRTRVAVTVRDELEARSSTAVHEVVKPPVPRESAAGER
ncbi:MAG: VWA domain-containing protein [Acidobacteriota bacterium]